MINTKLSKYIINEEDTLTVRYFCKYIFNESLPVYLRGCLSVGETKVPYKNWWQERAYARCPNCGKTLYQDKGELL